MMLIFILLLLTSCSGSGPSWTSEEGPRTARRALFASDNEFRGIGIEIREWEQNRVVLLNIYSIPLQEGSTEVTFVANGERQKFSAQILTGGQIAKLSDEGAEFLIRALECGHVIEIQLGRYEQIVSPEKFSTCKKKLRLR